MNPLRIDARDPDSQARAGVRGRGAGVAGLEARTAEQRSTTARLICERDEWEANEQEQAAEVERLRAEVKVWATAAELAFERLAVDERKYRVDL